MVTGLKFAVVSAIFLLPFAYPHSALSRIWSLSYQEAVWMCSTGDHQACDIMYRYEMARSAVPAWQPGTSKVSAACRSGGTEKVGVVVDQPPPSKTSKPTTQTTCWRLVSVSAPKQRPRQRERG